MPKKNDKVMGFDFDLLKDLEHLIKQYPTIESPVLRAKVRHKVIKAMRECNIKPFGYSCLPDYMKE